MISVGAALLIAASVAACASPLPSPGLVRLDPDALVFRVTEESGFPQAPGLEVLPDPPLISMYGDGRIVRRGVAPPTEDPQVPTMVLAHAAEAQSRALIASAVRHGVLRTVRFECAGSFDFPTTTLRSVLDGRTSEYAVYALSTDVCEGLDREAAAGRQNLRAFVDELAALDRAGEIPWAPERLLVATSRRAVGDGEQAELVRWPLAVDPSLIGEAAAPGSGWERCGIVGPPDSGVLWTVLVEAETRTRFVVGGEDWWVDARPVLPDEQPVCPAPQ